ncbi:hypothetical protein XENOCAPTIV_016261 [Xenoophorus captivus]|uniref:Uncharacterized protein n=1 Tax=Xenoophorus captivus TaxID=1517983 RepID=A0ABV0QDF9_9TELE
MDQVSDDELDHGAEEDSDKEDQDLDKMFGAWLGELDKLTQGDNVDLDALMADLCSIEQELTTISKPNSTSRSQNKGQQRGPGGRSASTKHGGTGGSVNSRPVASNISLDDITSQLEKASLSMDEAARQTSSSSSSSSVSSTALRRPSSGSSGGGQHRRTGSVGAISEQEAQSQRSSINSACASASSMDSLDTDKGATGREADEEGTPSAQGQVQTSTEV